ncbi:MAG: ParB/RepB/Spo0J family partition protein [Candidatus Magasanikbacteria bacterium]|nr:ParB/RepB/Spo0J family partition protein [Candidatus Magasanikbacteria bacterium]
MALGRGLSSLIQKKTAVLSPSVMAGETNVSEVRVWNIPVSLIRPNPHQPRKIFNHDELEDLMNSIRAHGLLQPILVTETTDGHYELIAGERRLRGATMLGLATIPALVRKIATDHEKLELALIENLQRSQLNVLEEAFAYKRLIDEFLLSQEEIATQLGKSRSFVSNTMRLLHLPDIVQQALAAGKITTGAARALLGAPDEKSLMRQFQALVEGRQTVRDVEHEVKKENVLRGAYNPLAAQLLSDESRLREILGTKVKIAERAGKGNILISYYSPEERVRILKHFK